ncbi:MAG: flagellar motor switch protein FliN [Bryobacteraceae bacterium]
MTHSPIRTAEEAREWLAEEWSAQFRQALESMTGEQLRTGWRPAAAANVEALWFEHELTGVEGAALRVAAAPAAWHGLGDRILRAAGIDGASEEECRGTFLEVLTQAGSGLAALIGARLGREVTIGGGRSLSAAPAVEGLCAVTVESGGESYTVEAGFSDALASAMVTPGQEAAPGDGSVVTVPHGGNAIAHFERSKTFDLLMDVELPVSLSFGRAQLKLRDVIKLTTGSIVELNRAVSEPVEVIVNNCVIARGEVVVVDGNYGVRIRQIISRQDRLRTLN